jgi:PKD repeat protein
MRSTLLLSCLVTAGIVGLSACGPSEKPATTTPTTTPPAAKATPPTTMPPAAAEEEEYELDVIAEAEPDEGAPPLKVQFTASVEEETGGPFTFSWDFGDGQKSADQNPLHTYDKIGEYTATLTVTNQKGNKGTDEIDIFVETDEDTGAEED